MNTHTHTNTPLAASPHLVLSVDVGLVAAHQHPHFPRLAGRCALHEGGALGLRQRRGELVPRTLATPPASSTHLIAWNRLVDVREVFLQVVVLCPELRVLPRSRPRRPPSPLTTACYESPNPRPRLPTPPSPSLLDPRPLDALPTPLRIRSATTPARHSNHSPDSPPPPPCLPHCPTKPSRPLGVRPAWLPPMLRARPAAHRAKQKERDDEETSEWMSAHVRDGEM